MSLVSYITDTFSLPLWLAVVALGLFGVAFFVLWLVQGCSVAAVRASRVYLILRGWAIIVPIYLAAALAPLPVAAVVVVFILLLALREVTRYTALPRAYEVALGLLAVLTVWFAAYAPEQYLSLPLWYFLILSALPIMQNDAAAGLQRLSLSLFIAVWLFFFGGHIILLGHLDFSLELGRALVAGIILAISLSDVGAFVFGKVTRHWRWAQRTLIAPTITPNKHYLGLLGHCAGALVGLLLVSPFLLPVFSWGELLVVGACVGFFGLLGGLTHSLVKRSFDRKDSGSLIPGHGGVLDRIDSTVRVVGIVYYVVLLLL
jgi:phosphatidate cytidylyltransferase